MGQSVKIAAVGDICLGDHYFSLGHGTAEKCSTRETIGLSREIVCVLRDADIAFCNVECPLSLNSTAVSKVEKAVFRGQPDSAKLLSEAGFTVANIANNHICQHGEQAFQDTLKSLHSHSVATVGLAANTQYSSIPYITNVGGLTIGFVGYSLVPEKYMPKQNYYACSEEHEILQDVRRLAEQVDIVLVSMHAGDEGIILPNPDVIRFYRRLVESGADVVLGHHPHVFQPVEIWKQGFIAYSLGDFVFDLFWNPLLVQSAVLLFEINSDFQISFKIIPVVMNSDYSVVALKEKDIFLRNLEKAGNIFNRMSVQEYANEFRKRLNKIDNQMNRAKISYFFRNLYKGNFILKSRFLAAKLKSRLV